MTLAEANYLLHQPLKFGNEAQIKARLFVESVEEINALIRQKAKDGRFEDFDLAREVKNEFDPDYEDD